jgi:hypothetical protein
MMARAMVTHDGAGTVEASFWRRRIVAEYVEMPGLALTLRQASRLWQIDVATAELLLEELCHDHLLVRARDGSYRRA